MRIVTALLGLVISAGPALAFTQPQPIEKKEPRMTTAPVTAGEIIHVPLTVGRLTALQLPPGLSNTMAWSSPGTKILDPKVFGNKIVVFKPAAQFSPQPVFIYGEDASGRPRLYSLEADAVVPDDSRCGPSAVAQAEPAAPNTVSQVSLAPTKKDEHRSTLPAAVTPIPPRPCDNQIFSIRLIDVDAERAVERAQMLANQAAAREREANRLLNAPPPKPPVSVNTDYIASGNKAVMMGGK